MRIADTLLRRGHLSEDALVDAWYSGTHHAHMDTCEICADRAIEVSRWLEQTRDLGVAEADAAFPAERLAAQQSQIFRKLEQLDRPSKLLLFPGVATTVAATTATPLDHNEHHRVSSRWIAAAAAAGLLLGVIGGRLSVWQPSSSATRAATAAPIVPAPQSPETTPRAQDPNDAADLLLDSDSTQSQIRSLSAIDTLTPTVTVARASDRRR